MKVRATMNRYRLFRRRSGIYFVQDNRTGKQESLKTRDREQAERIIFHRNESERIATGHRQIAVAYLVAADPDIKTRKWSYVMDYFCQQPGKPATISRKLTAMKDTSLKKLRAITLLQTTPELLLTIIQNGTVSTNCYLRKLHNLARRMKWLPDDVLTRGMWPVVRYQPKRAITYEEHAAILAIVPTEERRKYYEVLWSTGAAQSDAARLTSDCIDWQSGTIRFTRTKLDGRQAGAVQIAMGPTLEAIIETLPKQGHLFPTLAQVGENDRSTAFAKHCARANVQGVTLHSYRYALVQRAKACGYNKRHAMALVGHSKEQTHDDYGEGGEMVVPSLEEHELLYAAAQQERAKRREERRAKIINLKEHIDRAASLDRLSGRPNTA